MTKFENDLLIQLLNMKANELRAKRDEGGCTHNLFNSVLADVERARVNLACLDTLIQIRIHEED